MRRSELFFRISRIPAEATAVFLAFYLGREIRLVTDLIPGVQLPIQRISEAQLSFFALSGCALFVLVALFRWAYRMTYDEESLPERFFECVASATSWFFYYIALVYLGVGFLTHVEIPRLIIAFALIIAVLSVFFIRTLFATIRNVLLDKKIFHGRKVLVLSSGQSSDVILELSGNPGYALVGYADRKKGTSKENYFGDKDAVIEACRNRSIDEIVSLDSSFSKSDLEAIFEMARTYGVSYRYADRFLLSEPRKTRVDFIAGVPLVEVVSIGLGPWGRVVKRSFDVAVSMMLILFFLPFLAVVALIVYVSDFHAPVYRSFRIGRLGRPFPMYKFRSMRPDADSLKSALLEKNERQDWPLFKIKDDPRVTRIGALLRRYDIDELPQLFNVLWGDMSLVGPRPHLSEEVGKYEESQKRVLTLKPGITGMAQVNGRHRNDFESEVRLDVFYIENWSLALDLKILLKTVSVVLSKASV